MTFTSLTLRAELFITNRHRLLENLHCTTFAFTSQWPKKRRENVGKSWRQITDRRPGPGKVKGWRPGAHSTHLRHFTARARVASIKVPSLPRRHLLDQQSFFQDAREAHEQLPGDVPLVTNTAHLSEIFEDEPKTHRRSPKPRDDLTNAMLKAAAKGIGPAISLSKDELGDLPRHDRFAYRLTQDHHSRLRFTTMGIPTRQIADHYVQLRRDFAHLLDSLVQQWPQPQNMPTTTGMIITAEDIESHEDDMTRFTSKGYNSNDLRIWLYILTCQDSLHAVETFSIGRLPGGVGQLEGPRAVDIPAFVFVGLLNRRIISPSALRILLTYTAEWCRTSRAFFSTLASQSMSSGAGQYGLHVRYQIFSRLLRHARRIWPESSGPITRLFLETLEESTHDPPGRGADASIRYYSDLALVLNKLLYELAEPAAVEPFQSVTYQEAAQAMILTFMADGVPALNLRRDGYRGVAKVQLARPKTAKDREWARLKTLSWPPWKEERSGIDAMIGPDHGISRAGEVFVRMQEAGYPMKDWERVAMIYAGWDTDQSPTIQTRAITHDFNTSEAMAHEWAARVRCTRTVQEAWACFLAYEDAKVLPHEAVYHAMMEKLVYEARRIRRAPKDIVSHSAYAREHERVNYPGDGKEVYAPPSSTHQETYTRSPPPNVEKFYRQLIDRGLTPSGRLLALAVSTAPTLQLGLDYLRTSENMAKLGIGRYLYLAKHRTPVGVPNSVTAALITLLARFPQRFGPAHVQLFVHSYSIGGWKLDLLQPICHAYYILVENAITYRPCWNNFFRSLGSREGPSVVRTLQERPKLALLEIATQIDRIVALEMVRHSLSVMRRLDLSLDVEGFKYVCWIFTRAVTASRDVMHNYRNPVEADSGSRLPPGIDRAGQLPSLSKQVLESADQILRDTGWLRSLFGDAFGHGDEDHAISETWQTYDLPRLIACPTPATLHAYLRALGAQENFDAITDLLHWMVEFWSEIRERMVEQQSGEMMMRRVIVATRALMEHGHKVASLSEDTDFAADSYDEGEDLDDYDGWVAPKACISDAVESIESVQEMGGWPTREEVADYINYGRGRSR